MVYVVVFYFCWGVTILLKKMLLQPRNPPLNNLLKNAAEAIEERQNKLGGVFSPEIRILVDPQPGDGRGAYDRGTPRPFRHTGIDFWRNRNG